MSEPQEVKNPTMFQTLIKALGLEPDKNGWLGCKFDVFRDEE